MCPAQTSTLKCLEFTARVQLCSQIYRFSINKYQKTKDSTNHIITYYRTHFTNTVNTQIKSN